MLLLLLLLLLWNLHNHQAQSWSFPNTKSASRRDYVLASLASIIAAAAAATTTNTATTTAVADETAVSSPSLSSFTSTTSSPLPTGPHLASEYYNNLPETAPSAGRFYFPTLTPPFTNRATYRYSLGRNAWALEQLLTFGNATATIRTNVIRLQQSSQPNGDDDGGLWVHSPQWPTEEYCQLLDELGTVRHVILPCNALEHKAPMKAFVQRYPQASVWIAPGQYGIFGSCGPDNTDFDNQCNMGYRVDGILSQDLLSSSSSSTTNAPSWLQEFDMCTLLVDLPGNAGPVSEVAFFHRPTTTLIVTDALVFIPPKPSPIFGTYFDKRAMSDPSFWPLTVLQSVFLPLRGITTTTTTSSSSSSTIIRYPGYEALENRLVRAPILRAFNDARAPTLTRAWIRQIAGQWKQMDRILTSHFASPITAAAQDVVDAFSYLDADDNNNNNDKQQQQQRGSGSSVLPPIACQDWQILDGINQFITNNRLGAPVVFDYQQGCIK